MKKKASIVVSILLLTVGFAAISTTLVINGNAVVGENAEDFEVIFTKATLDGEDVYESVVDDTKKIITFETNELKQANQKSVLNYEVTNNSTNYNAEVQINCKVKELEAYADPLTNMGVMAVLAWNCCYPNQDIQLPDIIDIVKVKMNTEDDIEDLKNIEPEIYNNIMDGIFNNSNERIRKKGIYVIAIPRNVEKIPKWILNYIDYDEVVNGNISKFHPILKSLNMNLIQTESKAGKTYMSNIIAI